MNGSTKQGRAKNATPQQNHTVTMQEVADEAGVSIATVSHVVNNKPGARIGDAARQRVKDTVKRLGYRPNALAQALPSGRSKFIGLLADAVATTPFAGQIIHGAQTEASRHGFVLLVADTDGDKKAEDEAISMMLEHKVRGILYTTWYHRKADIPETVMETDTILVNCFSPDSRLPAVVPNEIQGGRTATQLLISAGHERIGFINTVAPAPAREGRLEGYQDAIRKAGLQVNPNFIFYASPNQEGGYAITESLLEQKVTGVFCHNDRVAMGLYDGLREQGISIPTDMSVVGFDNQEVISAHLRPPLSTVSLPHYELGMIGVRRLLNSSNDSNTEDIKVPCLAVPRKSVSEPIYLD